MARSSALRVIAGCATLALSPATAPAAAASRWVLERTPNPSLATYSRLIGVSCPTPSSCIAVGYSTNAAGVAAMLVERRTGTGWAIDPIPDPAGAQASYLSGVSCTAASACTAVGYFTDVTGLAAPLAERWDGSGWTAQPVPVPPGAIAGDLVGVSCFSSVLCTAVGSFENGAGNEVALTERWDGSGWTAESSPNPTGAVESGLKAVSCRGVAACTAVGESLDRSRAVRALAERWNGTRWTIARLGKLNGASASDLFGVSCSTSSSCDAVGYFTNRGSVTVALAERSTGAGWTVRATASPSGARGSELVGASCADPSSCTAVGNFADRTGSFATLAGRWQVGRWVTQRTPRLATAIDAGLDAVSCTSPRFCVAIGYLTDRRRTNLTLAERFS